MSASGESPADEDPGVTANKNNVDDDAVVESNNVSDAETEPAMLEEEEMPTYMSLTCSSKPDESRAELGAPEQVDNIDTGTERASSPYASEQGAESVCVLSSGEESDRRAYQRMEDYDSEEMDMEEEDEEDEDDDSCPPEEEESDGDIEPEQFERSSDDFVLRYDGGLEKHHKERSRSLQDLTNSRGNLSRFVGKRRSIDIMGPCETEFTRQNIISNNDPLAERRKMPRSVKYDHVPSKVKMYIQEMKEQRRLSLERKNRENPEHKKFNETNDRDNNTDVSSTGPNSGSKTLKSYVQNAIDEMTIEEQSIVTENVDYSAHRAADNKTPIVTMSVMEEIAEVNETTKNSLSDATINNIDTTSENSGKSIKPNGLVDYSTQNDSEKMIEPMEICTVNGQLPLATILNLRSLSYEEYTNGDQTSSAKSNIEFVSRSQILDNNGLASVEEDEVDDEQDPLGDIVPKIVKTSRTSSGKHNVRECDDFRSTMNNKLDEMSSTLKQKNDQIDNMREAYQITLTENMSLKRELDEMKIFMEKCRAEHQRPETKTASIQTENATENEETAKKIDDAKPPAAKLLSSSIASGLSSIDQWTDSNCSPAISIDPPNMENALNSDDSFLPNDQRTPRKHVNSQSFITSSRILQTLANITQGRTKASSNLADSARNDAPLSAEKTGQSKRNANVIPNLSGNDENCARSRKRKASDMQGTSGSSQPFKIPYKPGADARRKINSDSNTDGVFKATMDEQQRTRARNNDIGKTDDNTDTNDDYLEDNGATDVPENVKCFVYHDEPDSKERSFLIQAEDSTKIDKSDRGGNFRECGPYLLGNVEIRMSEANGTINIWGKEVDLSGENADVDIETEDSTAYGEFSFDPKASHNCPTTPRLKCQNGSTFVCSTNKKARLSPQLARSGLGKYFRQAASHLTKTTPPTNHTDFDVYTDSSLLDNRTSSCEHCMLQQKRVKPPCCDHFANTRVKQHSCCLHDVEVNDGDYDCSDVREINDDTAIYETMSNILTNYKKCTTALHNASTKHTHGNEINCRHQTACRRHSAETRDDDRQQTKKRFSSCTDDIPSCNTRLPSDNHNCSEHRSRSHSHISCNEETHPLISNDDHSESPEIKRRRSSGKRVRGILTDLLRGCGGCRDPTSTSTLPKIRVTPCTPTGQASCSKRRDACLSHSNQNINDDVNEKHCHSCSRRADVQAQIENQLEILRVDMERLRSRSDAVLEMLNLVNAQAD